MIRRPGVSLLEVLVAIFIMAIGTLAILTLFPIGAVTMSNALRDTRCAEAAGTASALAKAWDVRGSLATSLFDSAATSGYPAPSTTGPSYPVYVDPFGFISSTLPVANGVSGTPGITRQTVSYVGTDPNLAAQWFSVLDDLVFTSSGVADTSAGSLNRPTRYTWAYMLKRPVQATPTVVNLAIVVYHNRTDNSAETNCTAAYVNDNTLTITWPAAGKPALRRNTWILDVTYDSAALVHADFYRVVSTTDTAGATTVEVIPPLKYNNINQIVVMEDVAEVFFKGNGN